MIKIFLTRHGETIWNLEGRMQGWNDSPLTTKGINQAKLLGERLSDYKIDAIYTSTLKRAMDTSEIISMNKDIPIITDERLKEINMGQWETKLITEIQKEHAEAFYNFWNKPKLFNPFVGENFYDIYKRVSSVMEDIIEKNDGKNILVVTHGVTLKAILCYFSKESIEEIWNSQVMGQTSLSIVNVQGKRKEIILCGDVKHLEKIS